MIFSFSEKGDIAFNEQRRQQILLGFRKLEQQLELAIENLGQPEELEIKLINNTMELSNSSSFGESDEWEALL